MEVVKKINEEIPAESKKQNLFERYDRLAQDIIANGDDIMRRRLSGEKVDKEETENQEHLVKNLRMMSQTILLLKKTGRLPEEGPSDEFNDMGKLLERVKSKKNSVAEIVQKLNQ